MMMLGDKEQMHPDDLKNLVLFAIAAFFVWLFYDYYLLRPKVEEYRQAQEVYRAAQKGEMEGVAGTVTAMRPRQEIINDTPRVRIENGHIYGSFALVGGRIDDVSLRNHYKTHDRIENMSLFSPMGSFHPRYANFGWIAQDKSQKMPGKKDRWQVKGAGNSAVLTPERPLELYWDNGAGLRFERKIEVDDHFLFTVTDRVVNNTDKSITMNPFSVVVSHGLPEDMYGRWIIHEGPTGYIDGELIEISYKKIEGQKARKIEGGQGWIALAERYWFTGLFPETDKGNTFHMLFVDPLKAGHVQPRYQTDVIGPGEVLRPGGSAESVTRVYVGPKKLDLMESYEKQYGWNHIDLAIDFGMYYFLTKPLFKLLHWLGELAGNFGLGIILLTCVVRVFVFPLANTSYRSFAKLRMVAPQMHEIRQKYENDKEKLQAALVELYEKENVNPMAGCLPILIQIPIFFALFKVLQVSVEMRHAPFYGWVHDLSAPDPTTVFNLFGLLPFTPPGFLMIGAWPCLMLFFMILQKKMNPPPQDKMQKLMMDFMPYLIVFILAPYPVGLVIYWACSNGLSVVQQYIIMKSMGVEPHLFKSKEQKELEKEIAKGPSVHPELEVIEHKAEEALFGEEEKEQKKPVSPPKPKKSKKRK